MSCLVVSRVEFCEYNLLVVSYVTMNIEFFLALHVQRIKDLEKM